MFHAIDVFGQKFSLYEQAALTAIYRYIWAQDGTIQQYSAYKPQKGLSS